VRKMETPKILTVVVLALAVMAWPVAASRAAPMGTAFTYQGRLIDANRAPDGFYDFQFKLFDANSDGNQVGWAASIADVDVIDGYFTVELFLGSASFGGDARWLEIGVRPGELEDPNVYTILEPRQEVTPTPYAIYAQMAGTDNDWMVSDSNMYSIPPGNVGIGTTVPEEKLTVVDGTIKCTNTSDGGWAVHGEAAGWYGQGVYGYGTGYGGRGVYGKASDDLGMGVFGKATATGEITNYGGYFEAAGRTGRGVYGEATDIGNATNYGGYFVARGKYGRAVHGEGTGQSARGVWGETSGKYGIGVQGTSLGDNSFGVYGFTSGSSGRSVCGNASKTGDVENYGGYFVAAGLEGRAVYGEATNSGDVNNLVSNYGGYFIARGLNGRGVHGEATASIGVGVYGKATGEGGIGVYGVTSLASTWAVHGRHDASGNVGTLGTGSCGVYGLSHSGVGVYGQTSSGHAGYFAGNVYVTKDVSALSFTDRTPYPKDLATAYEAVMSMDRLHEGQYDEMSKQTQLDHSKLSDFIRSQDGNRDLSATVSCHNEVLKDLISKQQELGKAQIYTEQLQKQNEILKARLLKLEAIVNRLNVSQKGGIK
jgi:hypothetical protein